MGLIQIPSIDVIPFEAEGDYVLDEKSVVGILFIATANGDAEIQNTDGDCIVKFTSTSVLRCLYIPIKRLIDGLKASTLDSGLSAYIYLKKK